MIIISFIGWEQSFEKFWLMHKATNASVQGSDKYKQIELRCFSEEERARVEVNLCTAPEIQYNFFYCVVCAQPFFTELFAFACASLHVTSATLFFFFFFK